MQFNLHPDEKQGTLSLGGEITLLQAQDLLALLNEALEATDHVVIDIEEVTDIDMAGLQLLCAAHKTAVDLNKQWVMDPNQPDVLATRVRQAGLACRQHCDGLKNTNCLWMGGTQ